MGTEKCLEQARRIVERFNIDRSDWTDYPHAELEKAITEALKGAGPQWRPIETAPKDGTYVLLWADTWRHPFVGYASNTPSMAYLDIPTPTATEIQVFVTHWAPLLEPPTHEGGG